MESSPRNTSSNGLWQPYTDLVTELLWDDLDIARLSRALIRTGATLVWIMLAVAVDAAGWWWGIPMLLVSIGTIFHARRLPTAGLPRPLARVMSWLLPQPKSPRLHAFGLLDILACVIIGLGTGWMGQVFQEDTQTRLAAPAATLLAGVVMMAGALNVSSHVSWELGSVAPWKTRARPFIGLTGATIAMTCLWPGPRAGDSRTLLMYLTFVVGLAMIGTCAYGQWRLTSSAALRIRKAEALRRAVRRIDARHIHQIKNHVRPIREEVSHELQSDSLVYLRQRADALWATTNATESLFKDDGDGEYLGATEAMAKLVDPSRFPTFRVVADLDPAEMKEADRELVWTTVTDLASNAMKAHAASFELAVTAMPDHERAGRIVITAVCDCKVPDPVALGPGTSLAYLKRNVELLGGSMTATDYGGRHAFRLDWPVLVAPRPRNLEGQTT